MKVVIRMSAAAPGSIRANGAIRARGKRADVKPDVGVRVGSADGTTLPSAYLGGSTSFKAAGGLRLPILFATDVLPGAGQYKAYAMPLDAKTR